MWNEVFLDVWTQLQEGILAGMVEWLSALFGSFLPGA
jgi:hypothetical protein